MSADLPAIADLLHDDPACPECLGEGLVCEDHPWRAWESGTDRDCRCGGLGALCSRGACGWCWDGVESVWPEGCPPHEPGQHIRDDGDGSDDAVLHEVVLDRDPSPDEISCVRNLFEASSDVSLEATVAHFASVGIGVVWMRRLTRTEPLAESVRRIMEHKAEEQAEVVRSAIQQSGRAVVRDEADMRARTRRALDPFDLDDWP